MKTFLKIWIAAVIALMPATTMAQENNGRQGHPDRAQREAFGNAQASEIAKKLDLNEEQTGKFTETYLNCQKEMWSLRKHDHKRVNPSEMTEEQAKAENQDRLESQQKFLDLRKKYYKEYSKFLTQKQIMQVNEIEKKMMDRMMQGHQNDNRGNMKRGERGPRKEGSRKKD